MKIIEASSFNLNVLCISWRCSGGRPSYIRASPPVYQKVGSFLYKGNLDRKQYKGNRILWTSRSGLWTSRSGLCLNSNPNNKYWMSNHFVTSITYFKTAAVIMHSLIILQKLRIGKKYQFWVYDKKRDDKILWLKEQPVFNTYLL